MKVQYYHNHFTVALPMEERTLHEAIKALPKEDRKWIGMQGQLKWKLPNSRLEWYQKARIEFKTYSIPTRDFMNAAQDFDRRLAFGGQTI